MHTFAKDGLRVHFNSDFSGTAIVQDDETGESIEVSALALLYFAREAMQRNPIPFFFRDATREELEAMVDLTRSAPATP